MKTQTTLRFLQAALALSFLATAPASSQQYQGAAGPSADGMRQGLEEFQDNATDTPDEYGAVYGRLTYYEGGIFIKREDLEADGNFELAVNSPLIPGDQVWTGEDGRVEIQLADGSLLRLDANSRLSLLNLADTAGAFDDTTLLRLLNGGLFIRTQRFDPRERRFQVDTPAGSVFLLSEGVFRIDVSGSGTTTLASYRGVAEVLSNDISVIAHSGERLTVSPDRAPSNARAFNTLRRDDFDLWSENRDDALAVASSGRGETPDVPDTVRPYVSELNRNGDWVNSDEYGWVWKPGSVDSSWRPYYYGHWVSAPVGPVWVSYESWGWAPYHYGRWHFTTGLGWFWSPGHIFSGAYVTWAVGPSYYGWSPTGYYGYPVVYGSYSPWSYVHHGFLFNHHVHNHYYSSTHVRVNKFVDRRVVLRKRPRLRPGYTLERRGSALYSAARSGKVDRARTRNASARRAFKQDDNSDYRRIKARKLRTERPAARSAIGARKQRRPSTGSVAGSTRGRSFSTPRRPTGGAIRPIVNRPGTGTMRSGATGNRSGQPVKMRVSPITGKQLKPTTRAPGVSRRQVARPSSGKSSTATSRSFPKRGSAIKDPRSGNNRQPVTRKSTAPGNSVKKHSSQSPHTRAHPGKSLGSRKQFVMRNRTSAGSGSKPGITRKSQAPPRKSPTMKRTSSTRSKPKASRPARSSSKKKGGKKKGGRR
jgi:hypothetical protein